MPTLLIREAHRSIQGAGYDRASLVLGSRLAGNFLKRDDSANNPSPSRQPQMNRSIFENNRK